MIESRDVTISHLESDENAWWSHCQKCVDHSTRKVHTISRMLPLKPPISRTIRLVSISMIRTVRSSQTTASRPLSCWSSIDEQLVGNMSVCSSFVVWKSKNCWYLRSVSYHRSRGYLLALIVPSYVLAMSSLFNESVARPLTGRSFSDEWNRAAISDGRGPRV